MNSMHGNRDPEAVLAAWLDEGPVNLPDLNRRAILTSLPSIPQARRGRFAPRRFPSMTTLTRFASAALVVAIGLGGAIYLGSGLLGSGGPGPTPSPSASPEATATAAPIDTTDWISFSSTVFGYDSKYPAGWTQTPGTRAADQSQVSSGETSFFDHFRAPAGSGIELLGTSTQLPIGMSEAEWISAYRQPVVDAFGEACFPPPDAWQPVIVDGQSGGLYVGCSYVEATTFVDGRAYVFTYSVLAGSTVGDTAKRTLLAFLSTVRFHPEAAAAPPSPSPAPS